MRSQVHVHVAMWCTKVHLGGPSLCVAIDETFLTKKKKQAGGFRGHTTVNNKTIVLGAVELENTPRGRRETGRTLLQVIPNRAAGTIKKFFRAHVPNLVPSLRREGMLEMRGKATQLSSVPDWEDSSNFRLISRVANELTREKPED